MTWGASAFWQTGFSAAYRFELPMPSNPITVKGDNMGKVAIKYMMHKDLYWSPDI